VFTNHFVNKNFREAFFVFLPGTIAAFLLSFFACAVTADTMLPSCKEDQDTKNARIRIDSVVLGMTTMDDVLKTYGKAPETVSKVEECCTQRAVCFLSPDKGLAVEFGGWTSSNITSFRITNDKNIIDGMKSCAVSSMLSQPIRISTGLNLGMSKSDVIRLLGAPITKFSTRDDEIEYDFKCHPTDRNGDWTRATYILIRFKEGKSVLIRINQDTQG